MGRDHLEVVEDRVTRPGHRAAAGEPRIRERRPIEAEDRAVAPQHDAAGGVAQGDPGIVDPGGQRVEVDGEGLPVGRRDAQAREPGRQVGEQDYSPQPLGAVLDDPARPAPLGPEGGVLLDLGGQPAVGVPRQRDPERTAIEPDVEKFHQRRLAARRAFAEPEHLLVVHPPAAMLDEVDDRPLELHRAEHHLARDQVGEVVAHPNPRQVGEQHPAGVADDEILQHQVVEERSGNRSHVHMAEHHAVQHARHRAGEEIAARRRQRHGRHDPEHHRDGPEDEDEEEPREPPPHQNGCPTAK